MAAIVLVAWSCLVFPQDTLSPMLDSSWADVLLHAHANGLQFGHDIVFTYGPLGFFSIPCFFRDVAVARMFFEVTISLGIAAGLCLVAWRMILPWRLVLLGFFIFVSTPLHWGGSALFLDLALFAWGLLCFLESGPRLPFFALALVVLAAVGALIKFTFLVTALFTVGLLACHLALRGKWSLAAGVVIGFVLVFLLGWVLLGQKLSGLAGFLSTSSKVAQGYNLAMARSSAKLFWVLVMTIAALVAVTLRVISLVRAGMESTCWQRGLLLFWMACLLFQEWKYGCVRADFDHAKMMLGIIPIVAVSMEALPATGKRAVLWSRMAGLVCMVATFIFLYSQPYDAGLLKCAQQTCKKMSKSIRILTHPSRYLHEKTEAFQTEQAREQLPQIRAVIGPASADVFGQHQAFALFNGFDYRPRPVFQSYSAHTQPLMEMNERFYLSQNAPQYVLFNLEPIDDRFPPLEDAWVMRDLLLNYQPTLSEGEFLLFQHRSSAKPQLALVKEGTVPAGGKIDLRGQGDANLWLEIELQSTWLGRLRQFLYKPPEVRLVVRHPSDTNSVIKFHAPPAMLSTGFLASPMLMDNRDVMKLYTGDKVCRPDGYVVEPDASPLSGLEPEIHFRLYRIENKLGPRSL